MPIQAGVGYWPQRSSKSRFSEIERKWFGCGQIDASDPNPSWRCELFVVVCPLLQLASIGHRGILISANPRWGLGWRWTARYHPLNVGWRPFWPPTWSAIAGSTALEMLGFTGPEAREGLTA
jgi:hypothetical protein